jgi:hypothetical protein
MQFFQQAAMPRDPARECRAPWAVLLCAAVLALTGWSGEARASCGDYVVVVNPSAEYLRNRSIEHSMPVDRSCPCQGPQCRSSDSSPPMPVGVQTPPEYAVELVGGGKPIEITLFGRSSVDDWLMPSEAHHLIPDPPPRNLC